MRKHWLALGYLVPLQTHRVESYKMKTIGTLGGRCFPTLLHFLQHINLISEKLVVMRAKGVFRWNS